MKLHLEPVVEAESVALGSYADFEKADFSSSIEFGPVSVPDGEDHYSVTLTLNAGPEEGQTNFPYRLEIQLIGIFDGKDLPVERRKPLVAVNGASMLYGIAREMLLGLTFRSVGGPVMLPTVEFSEFGREMEEKAQAEGSVELEPRKAASHSERAPKKEKPQ
ncbi:protein-export chaperone SecB [Methylibium sp. Root1272]|uniref:protein-export chaperone SecB n=1 Tax=Methylibium sp. Root1272 TaxID=1736441 RepID=UPI001F1DCBB4|nr:protein-export chaperone SecB [Methylibium sp. Root1272]